MGHVVKAMLLNQRSVASVYHPRSPLVPRATVIFALVGSCLIT